MSGATLEPRDEAACAACLRRSWLIARLGSVHPGRLRRPRRTPYPGAASAGGRGSVAAVAPKRADELLEENSRLEEGVDALATLGEADCWACCRHDETVSGGTPGRCRRSGLPDRAGLVDSARRGDDGRFGDCRRRAPGDRLRARGRARTRGEAGLRRTDSWSAEWPSGSTVQSTAGALERGRTVAVLAGGPDRPYPATHARLYRRIVESGLVISEMPAGYQALAVGLSGPESDHGRAVANDRRG